MIDLVVISLIAARVAPAAPAPATVDAPPSFSAAKLVSGFIEDDDFPSSVWVQKGPAQLVYRTLIAPTGRVERCEILKSSGVAEVDQIMCQNVTKRFRYAPARDDKGNAVFGVVSQTVTFRSNGRPAAPSEADYGFAVNSLPGGAKLARVQLAVLVSPQGAMTSCAITDASALKPVNDMACSALMSSGSLDRVRDAKDNLVTTVRRISLDFRAK